MLVIVPMAGLGSRFRDAGFTRPKPLIDVLGRPMYSWAVDSLPLDRASRLIFVLLSSQPEFSELQADVLERYAQNHPVVLSVPQLTEGQLVTVMTAEEMIDTETPLMIHNADTAFRADHGWVDICRSEGVDGALLVFPSSESRWSYARTCPSGDVVEVREKVVISDQASTGTYYFGNGHQFCELARRKIAAGRKDGTEYYVGPLYNDLIAEGGRVKTFWIEELMCFGTPEDLENTLKSIRRDERERASQT